MDTQERYGRTFTRWLVTINDCATYTVTANTRKEASEAAMRLFASAGRGPVTSARVQGVRPR